MQAYSMNRSIPCLTFLLAWSGTQAAPAQVVVQRPRDDVPVISRLSPAGAQLGRTTEVTIEGERLDELKEVVCPAVRLVRVLQAEAKRVRLELTVPVDATPGVVPFYVLCKAGLSNPRLLRLDDLPTVVEREENDTRAKATDIPLPVAAHGGLTAGDFDFYRFTARAGAHWVFDVEGQRVGSAIRPVLTLYDAEGRELELAMTPAPDIAPDVRLAHTFARDGTYAVRVHELTYQGSSTANYVLRIGNIPYAASMFPLGGRRGSKVPVVVEGGSLPAPVTREIDLTGSVPWRRTRPLIPTPAGSFASPMWFAVGDQPELVEQEPNHDPAKSPVLETPVTINGRIDPPGERDCFRFRAAQGTRMAIRVLAQQLGSPLDALVSVTDASGKVVATQDDRQRSDREPPVVRAVASFQALDDPLVDFTAPAAGEFVVSIEDVFLRGGKPFAYRLELAPPPADFELLAQPGRALAAPNAQAGQPQNQQVFQEYAGQGTGSLSLDRGGQGEVVVRALRSGYNGPIELTVEGLPPGVQSAPATIATGQTQAVIGFRSAFDADSTARFVRIVGKATIGQSAVTRPADHPLILSSLPTNGAARHDVATVAIGISSQRPPLALQAELAVPLAQASKSKLRVSIKRREGFAGDVTLRIPTLPGGLTASTATIPADREQGDLELTCGLGVEPGKRTALLEGTLRVKDRKEPVVATIPFDLDVQPLVALELLNPQVDVPERSSARVEFRVLRHGPLAAAIELTLATLPAGVSAEPTTIPPDAERFVLMLQAGEKATASPIRRIVQVRAKTGVGNQIIDLPALRFALRVTKADVPK
jgi:hypothetical protein